MNLEQQHNKLIEKTINSLLEKHKLKKDDKTGFLYCYDIVIFEYENQTELINFLEGYDSCFEYYTNI